MAEKWLEREIARGLQGLLALRLLGSPAEDSIELTLDVWLAALEGASVGWAEHLDADRVRQGFRTLFRICDRWPAPRQLLDNLPARPQPPPALPPPRITPEQRQKNLARLREISAMLARSKRMFNEGGEA